jgi:hypothetical protein
MVLNCAAVSIAKIPFPITIIFSLNPFSGTSVIFSNDSIYQEWYFKNKKVQGVIMTGDKSRNKMYEKAIYEHWTKEQIKEKLQLSIKEA